MSAVTIITGFDALLARHILTWFARQDEGLQVHILQRTTQESARLHPTFHRFTEYQLTLAGLVLATHNAGWADERAYHSSKSISEAAAKGITARRHARAKAYLAHRDQVRLWLAKHWGKVMDMRRAGLSWRRASVMIADEHGISISHSALHNYWRQWNES